MLEIQKILHQWYHENKRDLPWRRTQDAYKIWVSEIMLQQTQVVQGLPYYLRFVERFPIVQDLADADEEDVLKLWQGLGYYSRARNLHTAAKQVVNDFSGVFPTNYDALISLKGIGDYTASAVSSFSSGEARACIDGNVIRLICRLFGIGIPYDTGEGQKTIRALANELLYQHDSATHNQSVMEFGALQCSPKKPNCEICPLQSQCIAFARHQVLDLPLRSKKTKVQNLFLYYFVFQKDNNIIIQQRSDSGIWKNMYEFPLLESKEKYGKKDLLKFLNDHYKLEKKASIHFSNIYTHILSHRKIQATFIHIKTDKALPAIPQTQIIATSTMERYPVSRLIERFWDEFDLS